MDYLLKKVSHYCNHITGRHTQAKRRHQLPSFLEEGNNGGLNDMARLKMVAFFFFFNLSYAKADTKKEKKEEEGRGMRTIGNELCISL